MFLCREATAFNSGNVAFNRALNVVLSPHEIFHEFWCLAGDAQAKHIVKNQYLPVGAGPAPMTGVETASLSAFNSKAGTASTRTIAAPACSNFSAVSINASA